MIEAKVFEFLTQLKTNNNREWFNDNKALFNEVKASFEVSMQQFIDLVYEVDPSVGQLTAKECVFRIYRDTRFAKDKTPYKTNMGGFVACGGRKSALAGYYLHVEPGASMLAGGLYCPPSDILKAVRREIYNFADEYKAIINAPQFKTIFPERFEDKLKMAPKGFPKDFEDIELLKYKSFAPLHASADEDLMNDKDLKKTRAIIETLAPHNTFINRGITADEEEIIL